MKRGLLLSLAMASVLAPQGARAAEQPPSPLPAARDAQKLVLASMFDRQDGGVGLLLNMIYTEAFRRMGVGLEIRSFPATRARVEALAGNVDGEVARAYEYGALQRSLVRVPEATLTATTSAYARDPAIHLDGWESLRGTLLRVEFRAGYAITEQHLEAVVPVDRLSRVATGEQGLKKLALGRSDIYVDNDEFVESVLASGLLGPVTIYKAGVLDHSPIYAYLNKRHAHLAERLADVLRKMKAEGEIERIRAQVREHDRIAP